MTTKRLRIFAGPNGSGKSTLKKYVTDRFAIPFGYFVNADEIEKSLKSTGRFDFSPARLSIEKNDFAQFARQSSLSERAGQTEWLKHIHLRHNCLFLPEIEVNSYHAALVADFLREKLLVSGVTFSIETVLSDARKIEFLKKAKAAGYRIYLYFVATDNPDININRVKARVASGGHFVSDEKVRSRYDKALALLPQVVGLTNRAYLFDNSAFLEFVAEITDGRAFEFQNGDMPNWLEGLF